MATTAATRMPTYGVDSIHNKGLVKLAHWTAQRHKRYGKFIEQVQNFVAKMTIAEKEARLKAHKAATKPYTNMQYVII